MSEHKGWATPAPAGLVALAVACFGFFAILTGKVTGAAAPVLGIWLIGGFVIQISVALIELKNGHLTGGNVFLFFSAFFMLVGGMEFIFKFFVALNKWKVDFIMDGWLWLPLFITLILWTPAYLKESSAVMGIVVLLLDVTVFCVTFMDMGKLPHSYASIAGYCALIAGVGALWIASAAILNTAFGKTILPMPGPIIK